MPLNDAKARNAKPRAQAYRLSDAKGMYLEVSASGGRHWRLAYRFAGKRKLLSLGSYPDVTLTKARNRRDDARRLLADGVDPGAVKQASKRATVA
ncbi:MAG: DUF4102 domain-containing protein, partial [Pseudomonadales bacterium]|nr:DUF4102 domain-containing protein [Pseudomonadales bacterium]